MIKVLLLRDCCAQIVSLNKKKKKRLIDVREGGEVRTEKH